MKEFLVIALFPSREKKEKFGINSCDGCMEISAKPHTKTRYMSVSEEICSMSSRVLFVHKTCIVYKHKHFVFS